MPTLYAGADFGFVNNSSAIAIAEKRGALVYILAIVEQRPRRGAPLRPSAVVADFANIARHYGLSAITSDAHYAESIKEHLREHGMRLVPAPEGQTGKVEAYLNLRKMVNEGRLRIPREPRLLQQLKSLTAKPTSGGGLQIGSPVRGGAHGDVASAVVLAVWGARGQSEENRAAVRARARNATNRAPPVGAEFAMVQEGAWNEAHIAASRRSVPRRDPADYDVATRSWKPRH
jgi:hypothetical protein